METYTLTIAGVERQLPLCRVNDRLRIAAFVMFGDVEVTEAAASALLTKAPDFDVILTAEAKGIPLAYEMARQSGRRYLIARKYPKLYMPEPVSVTVKSITTDKQQMLYLDRAEMDTMKGRRVLLIDDVISTGESLRGLEQLAEASDGWIVGKGAVLAEGEAAERPDIFYLEPLPLFFD